MRYGFLKMYKKTNSYELTWDVLCWTKPFWNIVCDSRILKLLVFVTIHLNGDPLQWHVLFIDLDVLYLIDTRRDSGHHSSICAAVCQQENVATSSTKKIDRKYNAESNLSIVDKQYADTFILETHPVWKAVWCVVTSSFLHRLALPTKRFYGWNIKIRIFGEGSPYLWHNILDCCYLYVSHLVRPWLLTVRTKIEPEPWCLNTLADGRFNCMTYRHCDDTRHPFVTSRTHFEQMKCDLNICCYAEVSNITQPGQEIHQTNSKCELSCMRSLKKNFSGLD